MMIPSKSNTLLQATEYQAGSDQRGGVLDPRSDLNSVLVGAKRVPSAHSTAKWTR